MSPELKIGPDDLLHVASQFVEAIRKHFDRSFELVDFRSYVRVYRRWREDDWHYMDAKAALIHYFNGHYDLVRQSLGMRRDFINDSIERKIDLGKSTL